MADAGDRGLPFRNTPDVLQIDYVTQPLDNVIDAAKESQNRKCRPLRSAISRKTPKPPMSIPATRQLMPSCFEKALQEGDRTKVEEIMRGEASMNYLSSLTENRSNLLHVLAGPSHQSCTLNKCAHYRIAKGLLRGTIEGDSAIARESLQVRV